MRSIEQIEEEYRLWEAQVGLAIVKFGEIEYITVKCLELVPRDRIVDTTARLRFQQRVDVILEIFEGRQETDEHAKEFVRYLVRARNLATMRNRIAHNPVMLDIYTNTDQTAFRTRYAISSARRAHDPITFEQLKEFAADVEDLASSMWVCFSNLEKTSEHLWREWQEGVTR